MPETLEERALRYTERLKNFDGEAREAANDGGSVAVFNRALLGGMDVAVDQPLQAILDQIVLRLD